MLTEEDQERVKSHEEMVKKITAPHVPGIHTRVMATQNVIITEGDGYSCLEAHGCYIQLIAESTHLAWPFKRIRFEGPIVPIEKMTQEIWSKFQLDCGTYAEVNMETVGVECTSNLRPKIIKLK